MSSSLKLRRALVGVAMGREPAELVVRGGRWVCVQSGEIISDTAIAVKSGHVAYVGSDATHCIGPGTLVIEAQGKYMVPGLLDAHMHVESSMVTVTQFVRATLPHGTTGIFIDPHEIANVFGLRGVRLIVNEASRQPIHVWVQMPSCVPSAPGLETSAVHIGPAEVAEAVHWPGVVGLGEMMDFTGVARGDRRLLGEMAIAHSVGKTVGGHYASPDLGKSFHAYAAGGAEDDHEGTRSEDAVARVRQGMRPMLRYGSAAHNVAAQVTAITRDGMDSRRFVLCTDDSHAQTLATEGHMDRVVRHAMAQGLPPMTAIQMATINAAENFELSGEIGMIAPGRWADLFLVDDLQTLRAELVIAKGQVAARDGKLTVASPVFKYPAWAQNSVHLRRPARADDFAVRAVGNNHHLFANVIGVTENQLGTRHLRLPLLVQDGEARPDVQRDIAKVALIRRHKGMSGTVVAFVQGFGFTARCAVASTVAHDCHQLLVVGTDEACMAQAANELAARGGGQVVVKDGRVIGIVELTIAGLMSREAVGIVADKAQSVLAGFRTCGCRINNPNIPLSFLALPVIPELRISDRGLVDVVRSELIPVLEQG